MKPILGIHALTAAEYHADPVDHPSLSASIATILCTSSPLHAWTAHPKLNPDFQRVEEEKFDVGTCAHALLLEGEAGVEVVDAADWRTNAAKEARDAARAAGRVPLLAKQWASVERMAAAVRDQLAAHEADPPLLTDGQAEQTLVWEEPGGVVCRARLDWLRDDRAAIDDIKTSSRSARPKAFERRLFDTGADVQAAMYIRGVQELFGETPVFRWAVVETSPPYAVSVVSPSQAVLTIGAKKVQYALDLWRRCLRDNRWPGYEAKVHTADLPAWEEAAWLERELEAQAA